MVYVAWAPEAVENWAQLNTPTSFTNTTHLLITPYKHISLTTTLETTWVPPHTPVSWWLTWGFPCCLHILSKKHLMTAPMEPPVPEKTGGTALKHNTATKQNNLRYFTAYSKRIGRTCSVLICFPNTYCLFFISAHQHKLGRQPGITKRLWD